MTFDDNEIGHVHISMGVSKLGATIPSISLPVGCTCRPDAPCFGKCYARRGRFAFRHNAELLGHNLDLWHADADVYETDVASVARFWKYFRWHSAGDIPDPEYLRMMVRVAETSRDTRFLCFTKKFELVNDFVDNGGVIPDNLTMVLSAWGNFIPENPHGFPVAYVRLKGDDNTALHIPERAHQCEGFCGSCVQGEHSCWDLRRGAGDCVVFNEH